MEGLLTVEGISVAFAGEGGEDTFVDGVSFQVKEGETLCIVGESGCGKSVTALSIMGLLGEGGRVTQGSVRFEGQELLTLPERALDAVRGNRLTMIFQDATSALNPVLTIGDQLTEAIRAHLPLSRQEAKARAESLLRRVGLSDAARMMRKYPHTLSGGMRQRVMIAIALSCNPRLLIADEPTTALDVTIQAQIMRLLLELKNELGMALLLITHDMGLVAETADRVLVMYAGQVVEEADVQTLFAAPMHPYTQALLQSVPSIRDGAEHRLLTIGGTVPEHYQTIEGCRFFNRCPKAVAACEHRPQVMAAAGASRARCWLAADNAQAAAAQTETAMRAEHAADANTVATVDTAAQAQAAARSEHDVQETNAAPTAEPSKPPRGSRP